MCFCKCCPYWCWCNSNRTPPLAVLGPPLDLKRKPKLRKTNPMNPEVFFDIMIENQMAGRIVFELYEDLVPATADCFRSLCTGERGVGATAWKELNYKGSRIHKVIEDSMCVGGDFVRGDGYGTDTPYGRTFPDETFIGKAGKIDHRGILALARAIPASHEDYDGLNGSQFFISFKPMPWLDGKHVVIGQVIDGFEVLDAIEDIAEHPSGYTWKRVMIFDCGELPVSRLNKRTIRKRQAFGGPEVGTGAGGGAGAGAADVAEAAGRPTQADASKGAA